MLRSGRSSHKSVQPEPATVPREGRQRSATECLQMVAVLVPLPERRHGGGVNLPEHTSTWPCPSAGRSPRAAATVLAVVVACCSALGATSTVIEGRHRTDRQCSLKTIEGGDIPPTDYCSFLPELGENTHRRVLIQYGESNCEFTLRSCLPVSTFARPHAA